MHDLQTTQDKLLKTPTGDVHGAFYRKLVSAGYKGHIGGIFGGGALYATIGGAVGLVVGVPLMLVLGLPALALIPAFGVMGMVHGVHVFSDIGTTAAIIAESASIRETRSHLLDRYYETNSEEERQEIQKMLDEQLESKPPEHMFHWKPLLIGAAIGGVIALACAFALPEVAQFFGVVPSHLPDSLLDALNDSKLFNGNITKEVAKGVTEHFPKLMPMGISVLTAIGAAAGCFIGLDREYVRRFLDVSENTLNDPSHQHEQMIAKVRQVERLSEVAGKSEAVEEIPTASVAPIQPPAPKLYTAPQQPDTKVHQIALERQRLMATAEHCLSA